MGRRDAGAPAGPDEPGEEEGCRGQVEEAVGYADQADAEAAGGPAQEGGHVDHRNISDGVEDGVTAGVAAAGSTHGLEDDAGVSGEGDSLDEVGGEQAGDEGGGLKRPGGDEQRDRAVDEAGERVGDEAVPADGKEQDAESAQGGEQASAPAVGEGELRGVGVVFAGEAGDDGGDGSGADGREQEEDAGKTAEREEGCAELGKNAAHRGAP